MHLRALVAVIVTTVLMLLPIAWSDTACERYKARFM
ncbi:endoglucanase, partial [Klebsiella pneumoniae]|nr:endoglucanase [Klebsiella pneumoniae]